LSLPGQITTNVITPSGLRAGTKALIQVKIGNNGYSDVDMSAILIRTDGNSKMISTDAENGVLLSDSVMFIPTVRNKPSAVILSQTTEEFSFNVVPNSPSFVGNEGLYISVVDNATLFNYTSQLAAKFKPNSIPSDVWLTVTNNFNKCLGSQPAVHFSSVGWQLSQHYGSFYSIIDLVGHTLDIADGIVPPLILAQSIDVSEDVYLSMTQLVLKREYLHHITARRSTGPFGKGWTSPLLELAVRKVGTNVALLKQRREYIFQPKADANSNIFVNSRLPDDYIVVNNTNIAYISDNIVYTFDIATDQLLMFQDAYGIDRVILAYDSNKRISSFTHSNGNAISVTYNANELVASARLLSIRAVTSEVFYTYNSNGLLIRVSDQNGFIAYDYTIDGDLKSIGDTGSVKTSFDYDDMNLLDSVSTFVNGELLQQVTTRHGCDGTIDISVYPQNITYSSVYGFGGLVIQTKPSGRSSGVVLSGCWPENS
jgi:YD repeat-containing protein